MMTFNADAAKRSASARLEFARHNACPSTGERKTSCPGYVIDHIVPLCAGGPDTPMNMQWQAYKDSLRKDAEERRLCRRLRAI
jgi:hypothetical protein